MNAAARPEYSIAKFEAGDIDGERFDHEAHVYVAWLYVQQFELAEAIGRFDAAIRRLVVKLGAAGKYHATLTWFFILLIAERSESDEPWHVFCSKNSDLMLSRKKLLACYYSDDRLFSVRARERFVLPDLRRVNNLVNPSAADIDDVEFAVDALAE